MYMWFCVISRAIAACPLTSAGPLPAANCLWRNKQKPWSPEGPVDTCTYLQVCRSATRCILVHSSQGRVVGMCVLWYCGGAFHCNSQPMLSAKILRKQEWNSFWPSAGEQVCVCVCCACVCVCVCVCVLHVCTHFIHAFLQALNEDLSEMQSELLKKCWKSLQNKTIPGKCRSRGGTNLVPVMIPEVQ